MVADGREKIADFIRFSIEKATLEKWVQSGSRGGGGSWARQTGTRFYRVDS